MKFTIPPGVFDILPQDDGAPWRCSHLWRFVENEIRKVADDFGYLEIRTPLFEKAELFQRGVGESSDIVTKEMYTFEDKGGRLLSLRPEGTAPAMRAFIENNLSAQGNVHKLFYIAPMFRYERSQAGRYRQHHQFGVEAIGIRSPEQDVEVIDLIYTLYLRLGLEHLTVNINSLGDNASRGRFKDTLKKYLEEYKNDLSEDSQRRLEINPLRILDSKNPGDMKIVQGAPSLLDFLSEESRRHFEQVQEKLTLIGIPYVINSNLVRGLDYYNETVFEIVAGELGAQNSISGGGRYDGLIKALGGPDLPAFGFGCGIERIIQTMLKQMVPLPKQYRPLLYFIPLGENATNRCFSLTHTLRREGIPVQMDISGRKLNKMMHYANQIQAQYVAVIGDSEINNEIIDLKDMETGATFSVSLSNLSRILRIENEKENLTNAWKELSKPFSDDREKDFFIKKMMTSLETSSETCKQLESALKNLRDIVEESPQ